MAETQNQIRKNISITGEEAALLEQLQIAYNKKLMMNLSVAQVIKRLIRQAAATDLG